MRITLCVLCYSVHHVFVLAFVILVLVLVLVRCCAHHSVRAVHHVFVFVFAFPFLFILILIDLFVPMHYVCRETSLPDLWR